MMRKLQISTLCLLTLASSYAHTMSYWKSLLNSTISAPRTPTMQEAKMGTAIIIPLAFIGGRVYLAKKEASELSEKAYNEINEIYNFNKLNNNIKDKEAVLDTEKERLELEYRYDTNEPQIERISYWSHCWRFSPFRFFGIKPKQRDYNKKAQEHINKLNKNCLDIILEKKEENTKTFFDTHKRDIKNATKELLNSATTNLSDTSKKEAHFEACLREVEQRTKEYKLIQELQEQHNLSKEEAIKLMRLRKEKETKYPSFDEYKQLCPNTAITLEKHNTRINAAKNRGNSNYKAARSKVVFKYSTY